LKGGFSEKLHRNADNLIHLAGSVYNNLYCRNLNYVKLLNPKGTEFLAKVFLRKPGGKFVYDSPGPAYASSSYMLINIINYRQVAYVLNLKLLSKKYYFKFLQINWIDFESYDHLVFWIGVKRNILLVVA